MSGLRPPRAAKAVLGLALGASPGSSIETAVYASLDIAVTLELWQGLTGRHDPQGLFLLWTSWFLFNLYYHKYVLGLSFVSPQQCVGGFWRHCSPRASFFGLPQCMCLASRHRWVQHRMCLDARKLWIAIDTMSSGLLAIYLGLHTLCVFLVRPSCQA